VAQVRQAPARRTTAERLQAVGRAVGRARDRVTAQLGNQPTPEIVAQIYARAAVEADDAHGRHRGLIVQDDGVAWSELTDLRIMLAAFADDSAHGSPGSWHPDCGSCDAAMAYRKLAAQIERPR
jgi:hypothetical protein